MSFVLICEKADKLVLELMECTAKRRGFREDTCDKTASKNRNLKVEGVFVARGIVVDQGACRHSQNLAFEVVTKAEK